MRAFTEQLDYIARLGYQGIPVHAIYGREARDTVGLTFDDGLESDYAIAFPELQKRGFCATFYVVTGYVGKRGYMNWQHIAALKRNGMEIGSHSATHRCLLDLGRESIVQELRRSKQVLEDRLGEAVTSFSVPFGFTSQYVINAALAEGYHTVCTSGARLADTRLTPKVYGRYAMRWGETTEMFTGLVRRENRTLLGIMLKEGGKNVCKRVMGREPWLAFRRKYLAHKL
jgi:peptidoglycan/xylan/chitin deacetylase (PgdA/CDA1 family)